MDITIKDYRKFENYLKESIVYQVYGKRIDKIENIIKDFLKETFKEVKHKCDLKIDEVISEVYLDISYCGDEGIRNFKFCIEY